MNESQQMVSRCIDVVLRQLEDDWSEEARVALRLVLSELESFIEEEA